MVLILKYNKIDKKIYFRSAYIRDIFGDFSQEQINEMSTEEIIEHVVKMEADIVGIFCEELDIEYYDSEYMVNVG